MSDTDDVFGGPFGESEDLDFEFEFDAAIASIPDGKILLQIQNVFFKKELKPEGHTTVGTLVQAKVAAEGSYQGNFITKYIWWGNDTPDPRGVRNWLAFASAALNEEQEGMISPKRYHPEHRDTPRGTQVALSDFDDCFVVGVLKTSSKNGEKRQEVVAWESADKWEEDASSY